MDKSEKALPAESIDGGAAGQFVKADNKESKEGAILYLHIQKDKGEVTFVSTHCMALAPSFLASYLCAHNLNIFNYEHE